MKVVTIMILFLIQSMLLIQYQTAQRAKLEQSQFKEVYIDQFKLSYFRKLLLEGFNHSEAIKTIIKVDRSGYTEPVLSEKDHQLIDSLVFLDNQYMVADSSSSIGTVAEGAEGKHVLAYVLNRLESNWLDSIANRRYKQSDRKNF